MEPLHARQRRFLTGCSPVLALARDRPADASGAGDRQLAELDPCGRIRVQGQGRPAGRGRRAVRRQRVKRRRGTRGRRGSATLHRSLTPLLQRSRCAISWRCHAEWLTTQARDPQFALALTLRGGHTSPWLRVTLPARVCARTPAAPGHVNADFNAVFEDDALYAMAWAAANGIAFRA